MKASDLNTIKRLIAEYGMKAGASTPVGQQKSGETAKANKDTKSVMSKSQSSMMNKPPKSPTLQAAPQTQVGKDQEKVEPTVSAVKDLDTGAMFKNEKGDELEVVDTVGNQNNPDAIVAKDKKGEFVTVDPKDEVEIAGEVTEGNDIDRLLKRKSKLKRKIKKVLRAQKYKTQGEPVFEINFNNRAVAQSGLNAPIQCGFEAETTWPDVQGGMEDDDGDWLEGKTWSEIADLVYDQEGSRSVDRIEENYREWLQETDYFYNAESDVIRELVVDRKEDEYYIDDYVSSRVSETDIEDYRDDKLADLESAKDEGDEDAATEFEEREDWDMDAWGREYVEENEQDSFEEWLEEQIRDNGEHWDDAWERAMEACDIDQYMYDEHGSWYDLLRREDIYLYNEDAGGGLDEVASRLEDWASNNSKSNDVRPGDYHSGQGVDNTYWRVESDSSIEGDGTGAEIISPVFDSPAEMLKEMKSLFEFLQSEGVETNSSTGLHVTMSMSGDAGKTNPLKMALLLGDKYLLKQFDREFNSYAKSQQDSIKKQLDRLALKPADVTSEELEQVEALLQRGIDFGKFSSINFKDAENSDGNKLVEFRIGGGDDYHEKFDTVAKSTIRYAVTLLAGHDENAFRQDYLKAMMRMINKQTDVSKDVQQKATRLVDPESMNDKVLSAFQAIASEKHYSDALEALSNAYMQLADVKKMRAADPQGELDLGEDEEADSQDWRRQMKVAQKYFVRAFAMLASDVASGANRAPAKAAQVAALRGAVKEFGLTVDILWSELQQSEFVKRFPGDHHAKLEKMAAAVNALLKKQDAKAPEAAYTITAPAGHVIAIPTEKHRALFGDIFDSGKKDDNATISQQDFKVINDDEIDKVKRARYEMEYNERYIENEQDMIKGMEDQLKTADPEKAKDLKDAIRKRQERVAEWQAENSEYRIDIDAFVKKHGFAPKSIRSGSEPIGPEYSFLHDDQRKELSQRFNIKFDVKESKMSAFDKFDKLPLEEQLSLLEKVDKKKIDEAWGKRKTNARLPTTSGTTSSALKNGSNSDLFAKKVDIFSKQLSNYGFKTRGIEMNSDLGGLQIVFERNNAKEVMNHSRPNKPSIASYKLTVLDDFTNPNMVWVNLEQILEVWRKNAKSAIIERNVIIDQQKIAAEDVVKTITSFKRYPGLLEAWSKKYKDSINCSNPKGFSQKAHCAGKKKKVNEEWYDVYRDYKGMGYSDADARAEANKRYPDEAPQRPTRVQQKPELEYYMFYDVPKDREQEALDMGVKKLKSGKFAIPVYNTSGRSTEIRIANANTAFGAGKQWAPKKTNESIKPYVSSADNEAHVLNSAGETVKVFTRKQHGKDYIRKASAYLDKNFDKLKETIEAEQDIAALLTAYGTPKKKKKKTEDATGKQEDEFHKKLDKLVHKTFGHSSDEKKKKKKKVKEGAVPERNIKRAVHEIMSKPLLGSDLQGQMNAYFAVPDPAMVRDFRSMIASGGKGVDLRPVFEMYAKAKLHPTSKKQAGIKESKLNEYDSIDTAKQEIIKTVSGLSADNKEEAQLLDRIYKLLNSERIGTTIGTAFQKPLTGEPMTDKEKQQIMQDMTAIIGGLDSDYATLNNFLQSLEQQGGVVNLKELAKPLNSFQNVFGSDIAINALVKLANYGVGKKQKGPGEYALAILSDKIHLATGEGDLEVDGIGKVELKAAVGSAGGRIGYGGGSQKAKRAVIDKYADYIPTVVNSIGGAGGSLGLTKFIQALNTDLPVKDQENQKIRQAIASDLLTMDMEQFAGPVIDTIAKTEDIIAIEDAYLRQNFEWYKDRDDFDALLLMHMPNKKTSMIRNADDLIAFRRSGHSNATSISIIPTQAGAGREQWAQLTLNKGKV